MREHVHIVRALRPRSPGTLPRPLRRPSLVSSSVVSPDAPPLPPALQIVIPIKEIIKVQKESVLHIPTSLLITTTKTSYFFASFSAHTKRNKCIREIEELMGETAGKTDSNKDSDDNSAKEIASDDEDEDEGGEEVPLESTLEFGDARPPEYDRTDLQDAVCLDEKIDKLSVDDFYNFFIHDTAVFSLSDFHVHGGDTEVQISSWQTHPEHKDKRVRDLGFRTEVKNNMGMGPPTTRVHKVQQYKYEVGKSLVIETTTMIPDVPFGDCFHPMEEWTVVPEGTGVRLKVKCGIRFIKITWKLRPLKATVESRTKKDIGASAELWLQLAKKSLASGMSTRPRKVNRRQNNMAKARAKAGGESRDDATKKNQTSSMSSAAAVQAVQKLQNINFSQTTQDLCMSVLLAVAVGLVAWGGRIAHTGWALAMLWYAYTHYRTQQRDAGVSQYLQELTLQLKGATSELPKLTQAVLDAARATPKPPSPIVEHRRANSEISTQSAGSTAVPVSASAPTYAAVQQTPAQHTPKVRPRSNAHNVLDYGTQQQLPDDPDVARNLQRGLLAMCREQKLSDRQMELEFWSFFEDRVALHPGNSKVHLAVRKEYLIDGWAQNTRRSNVLSPYRSTPTHEISRHQSSPLEKTPYASSKDKTHNLPKSPLRQMGSCLACQSARRAEGQATSFTPASHLRRMAQVDMKCTCWDISGDESARRMAARSRRSSHQHLQGEAANGAAAEKAVASLLVNGGGQQSPENSRGSERQFPDVNPLRGGTGGNTNQLPLAVDV